MTDDFKKHKEAFLNEAREHIQTMNSSLLELEKKPEDAKNWQALVRSVHTLKSMAATMGYKKSAKLCHAIEDLLDVIRNKLINLDSCIDLLFECFDFLTSQLKNIDNDKEEQSAKTQINAVLSFIKQKSMLKDTLLQDKNAVNMPTIDKIQSIEVSVTRLDKLFNLVEEILVNKMKLEAVRDQLNNPELTSATESMARVINDLQYNIMQVRMVSLDFVFNQFPRMVRDLAKHQNKEINLTTSGGSLELDRAVTDEISESLVHLVRNAVDHGLETPEERKKSKKPPQGELKLKAYRNKDFVTIEVIDDGVGLNLEKIKKAAIMRRLIAADATKEEILNSIFFGITTAKKITDVSGRGLGLDIVKQKIESIGGSISVKSHENNGTIFVIEIPQSLALIKTLFVRIKDIIYAIPIVNIERLVVADTENLKSMLNYEAIILGKEEVPITCLRTLFGEKTNIFNKQPIVIVEIGGSKVGLAVDELMTTQEIVIKPLNRSVKENKFFSGSAIIGSGEVVLVLDVMHLTLSKKTGSQQEILNES